MPYGLAASAWTLNPELGHDIASPLDAGTVWIKLPPGPGQRNALERL
ncbi:hypothetical protein [Arthrobacter sp. ISL-28]|nr:hypothetical protein [Arthrobacter sp. ISL-28]